MQRISAIKIRDLGTWAGESAHVPAHVLGGGVVGLPKGGRPTHPHHLGIGHQVLTTDQPTFERNP